MKRIIFITITLCLVFCSILPVYAEAWTSSEAQSVTSDVRSIKTYLQSFVDSWTTFFETGQGTISTLLTFQDLMRDIVAMGDWLAPVFDYAGGLRPSSLLSIWDTLTNSLSQLTTINAYVGQIPTTNNYLLSIKNGTLGNQLTPDSSGNYSSNLVRQYAHLALLDNYSGDYTLSRIMENGSVNAPTYNYLSQGSPIGNLMLGLKLYLFSFANAFRYNKENLIDITANNKWLYHATDNLTTWDSQGSTLTQVAFTPDSLAQGLYRYLAFIQRDVARLAYVFANDEELEARQLAQANQEQVLDDFIDPNGSGSISTTDLGNMSDASSDFKSNFSTNVGSSHIWDVFDNSRYNWFTQQTKNQLDTTPQTRQLKAVQNDYPTPLLDNYYDEISRLIGVDIND